MFSSYCHVLLYTWVKVEKLARIQLDQFVVNFWCVFRWQTRKFRSVTFAFLKTACFESCFDSNFICGAVGAYFSERSGWLPKEDRIQGEGKPKNSPSLRHFGKLD